MTWCSGAGIRNVHGFEFIWNDATTEFHAKYGSFLYAER
jgi:hypothetical protein